MDWTLEVVVLPVSDINRSIEFYRDQVGFNLDHHTQNEHMNVAQLTPPGSGCSIVFGNLPIAKPNGAWLDEGSSARRLRRGSSTSGAARSWRRGE